MRGAYLIFAAISVVACGDSFLSSTGGADGGAGPTTGPTTTGPTSGGGAQGAGSATATTGSGGNNNCADDELAAPPLPSGWELYVALSYDATASCPEGGDYDGYLNLVVNNDCDCGCAIDTAGCRAELSTYAGTTCEGPATDTAVLAPGCGTSTGAGSTESLRFDVTDGGELCGADSPTPAPLQYDKIRLCDLDVSNGCIPRLQAPFEQRACIWRQGVDELCPPAFPERLPYAPAIDDQRDCANCSCGDMNAACGGTLELFENAACANLLASIAENTCSVPPENVLTAAYVPAPSGGCTQQSGSAPGSASAEPSETVCCTQ